MEWLARNFEKIWVGWAIFCLVAGLSLTGIAVWAVYRLVTHYT